MWGTNDSMTEPQLEEMMVRIKKIDGKSSRVHTNRTNQKQNTTN